MRQWFRRHTLAVTVAVLGSISFAIFSWAERGYFCDQAKDHHSKCQGFWSAEHMHDWVYNLFSNYQSELLFGILVVVMLHKIAGDHDAEKGDT